MPFLHGERPPDRAATKGERWFLTVFAALFFGMLGAEILRDFRPAKLAAVLVPLFWVPLLVLHEAGHAFVARLCGWEVERVVLGYGKLLKRIWIAGTSVELRQFPLEGFVLPYPRDLRSPRLKNTLIYAAGPGAEILLVLAVYLALGGDVLFASSESLAIIAAQSLCVAALMGVIINLIPHWTTTGGGRSWSDGMGILMSHRLPDSYFEAMMQKPEK